jgi:YD repeat-containing protein
MPIVTFSWEGIGAELAAYLSAAKAEELSDSGRALLQAQVTFTGAGGTYTTPVQYWQIESNAQNVTVSVQADLSKLPSGYYQYVINAKLFGKDRQQYGALALDNRSSSAFGRGWTLSGLQEVNRGVDGSLQVLDPAFTSETYDKVDDKVRAKMSGLDPNLLHLYVSRNSGALASATATRGGASAQTWLLTLPPGTAPEARVIEEWADGTLRQRMPDGSVLFFSAPTTDVQGRPVAGKLNAVIDRYGNRTSYAYDLSGRILSITDPVGQKTLFGYSGDRIEQIVGPSGQTTTLHYSGKDLVGIGDPDGSLRSFLYNESSTHAATGARCTCAPEMRARPSRSGEYSPPRSPGPVTTWTS